MKVAVVFQAPRRLCQDSLEVNQQQQQQQQSMNIECIKQGVLMMKVGKLAKRQQQRCATQESVEWVISHCRALRASPETSWPPGWADTLYHHGESSVLRAGYQPRWRRSPDDVPSPVLCCSLFHMLKHASPGFLTIVDHHRLYMAYDVLWRMRHVVHSREFSACLPMRTMTANQTAPTSAGSE